MKRDDRVVEILMQRGNDFSLPNAQRADAFVTLASRHWQCSYDLTERKENKTTESQPDKTPVIRYKMPGDAGDFIRARQCVTDGLQFAEQAASLAPKSATAWNFKANLLREAAKLAEMEGDAAGKAEYERQSAEALETQRRASGVAPASVVAESADGTAPSAQPEQWKKLAVMGGVLNGKAIHKPMPPYPAEAIAAGVQGTVTVRIMVDEAGRVTEAEAISGPELLRAAAVTAARNSRYAPTQLSGQPVKVSGVITYDFVLQRN
jgi:TonB family protein